MLRVVLCVMLPCLLCPGHNGCLECFSQVRSVNSECPLCRKAFDPSLSLSCNHEMRDLIARTTAAMMDDEVGEGGVRVGVGGCIWGGRGGRAGDGGGRGEDRD